jgi:RND family efflux transporter MFP subunit
LPKLSDAKTRLALMGLAATVLLAGGIGFTAITNSEAASEGTEQPRLLAVQTIDLEPVTSYQAAREYTGVIVARRTSQLGFELAGKLKAIHVEEGDVATAGMALAAIDTEHVETRRRQLVARRAQATARLEEMVAGPREEDIAAARARVESLEAQVDLLKLQTARQKRLVASRATSQDEYEQHAFGLRSHEAQHNEAQHDLEELLNGTRKEQITAQRAVVAELDASIADIDVDLRKSILEAPFDGTIARRFADDGTVVEAGHPIFRLVEDQVLEAWIGLPVHATQQLGKESVQRVKIDGQYFDATVAARFPEVDPATRTRTIVLRLDDSAARQVVHGQVVRLGLDETVEASGYWLPSTALTKGARGLWTCFVAAEADPHTSPPSDAVRIERRDIEVLHTESTRVLVRGTLNAGDRVITGGTHRVVPGQLVRLARPSSSPLEVRGWVRGDASSS